MDSRIQPTERQQEAAVSDITKALFQCVSMQDTSRIQSIAQQLSKLQVDINTLTDREGRTPLHYAACFKDEHTALMLLTHFAAIDVNATDNDGVTPLHKAAQHDSAAVVALLLEINADPNAQDALGATPLHEAENRLCHNE